MTARFLVDEDLPRSTVRAMRAAGYETEDARDRGLPGHSDEEVFAYAQAGRMTLISADMGFSDPWRFLPGVHTGMLLIRLPNEVSSATLNREILAALADLSDESLDGLLVIIEVGRLRIRRPLR